jgi:hypothetical protein
MKIDPPISDYPRLSQGLPLGCCFPRGANDLEYARDLPQPHFLAGGLRERPIGGGAMGMGGMEGGMGGMRSVKLKRE